MADGIEDSAVVDKRDHRLLPGPKHGIHQQSQQQNVVAIAAFSTEISLCLSQPRLDSILHAMQNQHGQPKFSAGPSCTASQKFDVQGLLGSLRFATSGARYGRAPAFLGASHDMPLWGYRHSLAPCCRAALAGACLQFFLRNVSVVVVVSCYRCIRSTRDIGTREFPVEELLPGIQQLLNVKEEGKIK